MRALDEPQNPWLKLGTAGPSKAGGCRGGGRIDLCIQGENSTLIPLLWGEGWRVATAGKCKGATGEVEGCIRLDWDVVTDRKCTPCHSNYSVHVEVIRQRHCWKAFKSCYGDESTQGILGQGSGSTLLHQQRNQWPFFSVFRRVGGTLSSKQLNQWPFF